MSERSVTLRIAAPLASGQYIHLCLAGDGAPDGWATSSSPLVGLRTGDRLRGDGATLRVISVGWLPAGAELASSPLYLLRAEGDAPAGTMALTVERAGYALAWITLSDKGAAGKRVDESGPLLGTLVADQLDLALTQGFVIPDDAGLLKGLMVDLALVQGFDLILTTGGTGVGPRDVTPEATLAVIEKRLPGFERVMTSASLTKTPHGAISRAVAGMLGQALIINMPGSPKAVSECLEPLLPTLRHTLEKLQGDPSDCAALHK
ncbi:MogA/MoaB family molybdenum cofactor biosynthesis protein [Pseudodesulfovibrio sp. F-1]|uniref:Molybdopterin adenylyltransferase n=1 Tax=Pseudodesulfovibrio alkaliphilus TaxID=2661613 RepID=A0A7K1KM90_9BACT|nr:MogA/MoaB family molybdenum cofactor biosynthesis protein [Pseudodesulfovibrio alkaliphilus]MUM76992.1 MogA/MoaB family molybdenum cofactor biosynthesis protein [Pseudodesulfovibrio alkaliphilus]